MMLRPCLLALLATLLSAADDPPIAVVALDWSVPSGVSYDPQEPVTIEVALAAAGDPVDLSRARWAVRRTRELLGDPKSIWTSRWTDFEQLAAGAVDGGALAGEARHELAATFTPGRYGSFSLLLQLEPEGPWYRLACVAVIHQPAPGFKPRSFYQVGLAHEARHNTDERIDLIGRFGFKWVRWGNAIVKPSKDEAGAYDWREFDRIVAALRRNQVLVQGTLMPYGVVEVPTIAGRPITYVPQRKANLVVPPERFGAPGEFDTWADHVFQVLRRAPDVFVAGYIRNEPWEGGSISNYHATAAYMRDAFRVAHDAAAAANPDFQLLGLDSSDNLIDQFLVVDGMAELVDATTHHNYGSAFKENTGAVISHAMGKPALENENWASPADFFVVANITQKVAGAFAMVHPVSKGYDFTPPGAKRSGLLSPRPIGQVCATWNHFVEDCDHVAELHPEALPYVHLFAGRADAAPDKHCAIVFGTVRMYGGCYEEDAGDAFFPQVQVRGTLRVPDPEEAIAVSDLEGNAYPVERRDGALLLPLTEEPYYLVSTAGLDDLRAKLEAAVPAYEGHGCQLGLLDITQPLSQDTVSVRAVVENRLNHPQTVSVALSAPEGWTLLSPSRELELAPGAVAEIAFPVAPGEPNAVNAYPFSTTLTAAGGQLTVHEDLHVCLIARGTPSIDGALDEWRELGAVPVTLFGGAVAVEAGMAEWFPMYEFAATDASAIAGRFAALWDDQHLYLMGEITDPDADYRPKGETGIWHLVHEGHPYLYWGKRQPQFRGNQGDALRIAFDLFDVGEKRSAWIPPERQHELDTRFVRMHPDYEYDCYPARQNELVEPYAAVLARHVERVRAGEGDYGHHWPPFEEAELAFVGPVEPEVWRSMAPGVPMHNAYPFTPLRERDQGLVRDARLVVERDGGVWRHEAAIPWSELAEVRPEPGKEVRFAWFALDDGKRVLDWARGRSAAFGRRQQLHPTWTSTDWITTRWRFVGQ